MHLALHRQLTCILLALGACATSQRAQIPSQATGDVRLDVDTPEVTAAGNTFFAPAGWVLSRRGAATVLVPPEGGSAIALVDVQAPSADAAVHAAWQAYRPDERWPLEVVTKAADRDGWTELQSYVYQTSPTEHRDVTAGVRRANAIWTVSIVDMAEEVAEKRLAQTELIFGRLLPKGYTRESFAGKPAHALDQSRVAELARFVEAGRAALRIPGISLGLIDHGKVVFADGFGQRQLGQTGKPDADTLYMIASNTKALTTLLLAKLVEANKLTWETPVTTLLPSFRLGDDDTTRQVLVKHLVCACTGLPRQDLEWLFHFKGVTPLGALATLATVRPTSKFGEMFQYSNLLAGAGGYVGGHVANPDLELGAAYDKAMQRLVFDPLGMKATTFDFARALSGNHAAAHAPDVDGNPALAAMDVNYSILPLRPAGAAWSNVRDMLAYVAMELADGVLPDGRRYISKDALLARRVPQVPIGKDTTYGMGLEVDTTYGVPVVHHGGDMIGFHSDMIWLPDQQVGAVILTNANPGWSLRTLFRRKLLEVLFDGRPEADARLLASGKTFFDELAADRKLLTIPPDPGMVAKLATRYTNGPLGTLVVRKAGSTVVFDFGDWKSEVASRKNPDGSISFVTTVPGMNGFEFAVGEGHRRLLTLRDAQHEYVFVEAP